MSLTSVLMILIFVILSLLFVWLILGLCAYFFALRRKGFAGKLINKKFKSELGSYHIDYNWWDTVNCEEISILSNNEKLFASILKNNNSKKVAIVVHGYFGNYKDVNPWAKLFYEEGYNIIAPDLKAHGKSDGNKISMGYFDKNDMLAWINKAIEIFGKNCEIVLFGESMGGATVLMTGDLALPRNVKCIIADSPYSNAYKQMKYVISRKGFLPPFIFLPVANFFSKIFNKSDLKKASPIDSVKNTKIPILFIHGTSDRFVPSYMSCEMFDVSNKIKCKLYLVDGADHIKSYATNPSKYKEIVFSFINKNAN